VLLTNTPGVLDKDGNLITGITPKQIDDMVADGTLSGGMLPKIGSALDAARNGVKSVHIIDGRVEHALLLEILTDHGVGTMIKRHFLWDTHQFPDLARMVVFERGLKAMLQRLPGRKIIFSNAPRHYTEAILRLTGIRRCFDAIYSVEQLRFQPKPASAASCAAATSSWTRNCIMVEDSLPSTS
jgi:hypothetical protein